MQRAFAQSQAINTVREAGGRRADAAAAAQGIARRTLPALGAIGLVCWLRAARGRVAGPEILATVRGGADDRVTPHAEPILTGIALGAGVAIVAGGVIGDGVA